MHPHCKSVHHKYFFLATYVFQVSLTKFYLAPFGYDRVVNATIQMYHSDWENLLATANEENWYPANLFYDGMLFSTITSFMSQLLTFLFLRCIYSRSRNQNQRPLFIEWMLRILHPL